MERGRFITFEGIDGSGKTTQFRMLGNWLRERGERVIETVEPGGTAIGQQIRKILLNPASARHQPRTELLLYFASRAQNVDQVIRPGLESGHIVLCDRFTDSTLVYQGCGRGIDTKVVLDLDRIACRGLKPDLTFLIDIDVETSLLRARIRNERTGNAESRIDEESLGFHKRVRQGYLALVQNQPERFVVIDGRGAIAEVARSIQEAMRKIV